jgi:hypothetical protein
MKPKYMYWWWVVAPHAPQSPWLKFDYSRVKKKATEITAYDRKNGWKVGRVHVRRIFMEDPPK